MKDSNFDTATFESFGLKKHILKGLADVGYEAPTPIQQKSIPVLLEERDLIGHAQTGTGKTAAFALPTLQRINMSSSKVQCLVLVPTRELALQVSEAFHSYSRHMAKVSVLPVYGGQPFSTQLRRLKRGVQIVVGTPGRVMDHMRRGTLSLDDLELLILDEADEMLRMGFLEDVEWILEQTPEDRQTALFSATMPPRIRNIAQGHLDDPVSVEIPRKTLTVPSIAQFYLNVSQRQKLDVLTRLLGVEPVEAALIFTRTKTGAAELAQKLEARGVAAEPLHGDMSQTQREILLKRLRSRKVDVVVATDVAARGIDVEHITHVFNFDIPTDVDSYVHRIGRTGRAGRDGVAILFVTHRERRMMRDIERHTGRKMEPLKLPTSADVAARTVALFKQSVAETLEANNLDAHLGLVEELSEECSADMAEVAAAMAKIALGDKKIEAAAEPDFEEGHQPEGGMVRLFLSVGSKARVTPSDIVGAIANEANVPGREIGVIDVYERFSFVEIPTRYQQQVLAGMRRATIRGKEVKPKLATPERGKRGPTVATTGKVDANSPKTKPSKRESKTKPKGWAEKKKFRQQRRSE